MTIARTGNKVVDDLARAKARNDAAERAVKGRAKKASSKGGRAAKAGKFRGAGKAGRTAAKRSGKGISAKYNKKGSNASGAASYALKDGADLISSNCGFDQPSIADGLSPKMRFDIQDQIVHMTFSTPASSGKASDIEWSNRIEFIRRVLLIDDSFSYVATRHIDADHDHVHLFFNRISDVGERWKDNQIGLRLASLEEKIEKKFALKLTRREDFLTQGNLSKKVFEQSLRVQEQPSFISVQTAIADALTGNPDVLTFVSRLADQGISARPNLKNGELNGFGYKHGHSNFTGKQLGMNWASLKERVIYEPHEHLEILADIKREIDLGNSRPYDPEQGVSASFGFGQSEQATVEGSGREAADSKLQAKPRKTEIDSGNRENQGPSAHPKASHILAGLYRRLAERRARFIRLSERLKAEREGDVLAARFCAALDPSMTDAEVAQAFLRQESGSAEARALVVSHLTLSPDELKAVLHPYSSIIKMEEEHQKRMADADRQTASPTAKPSAGDLPSI